MVNIYVLKLKSGKYYVGKTNHTFQRFNQHHTGSGAKWTKKYPVVDLFDFHHGMKDSDENKITIQMMKKYGVKNVRGGSWTKVNMSQNEIQKLESRINRRRSVKRKANLVHVEVKPHMMSLLAMQDSSRITKKFASQSRRKIQN